MTPIHRQSAAPDLTAQAISQWESGSNLNRGVDWLFPLRSHPMGGERVPAGRMRVVGIKNQSCGQGEVWVFPRFLLNRRWLPHTGLLSMSKRLRKMT